MLWPDLAFSLASFPFPFAFTFLFLPIALIFLIFFEICTLLWHFAFILLPWLILFLGWFSVTFRLTFTFHSFASSTLLCTSYIHSIYLDSYLETINCVSLRHFVSKFRFRFSYKVDNKFGGHIKLVSFDLSLYVARSVCVALQIAYTPVYTYIYLIFFIRLYALFFVWRKSSATVCVCLFVCLFVFCCALSEAAN